MVVPNCLKTTICPNCGYSLVGLPEGGKCPECGRENDQDEIVLYGWGRGYREHLGNARGARMWWLLVILAFFLFAFLPQSIILRGSVRGLGPLFVLVMLVGPKLFHLIRRQKLLFPGRSQIRMNGAACVQYDTLPTPGLEMELLRAHGWVIPTAAALLLFLAHFLGHVAAAWVWIFCPILAGVAIWFWVACAGFGGDWR